MGRNIDDILEDLESFDDDYDPREPNRFRKGVKSLADGDYGFEILDGVTVDTVQGSNILRVPLKILFAPAGREGVVGSEISWDTFLTSSGSVGALGTALIALGVPGSREKFSQAMRWVCTPTEKATSPLAGVRFEGHKKTNENDNDPDNPYHNLYVNGRLPGADGPPKPAGGNGGERGGKPKGGGEGGVEERGHEADVDRYGF